MNVNVRVRIGIWLCHYDFGGDFACVVSVCSFCLLESVCVCVCGIGSSACCQHWCWEFLPESWWVLFALSLHLAFGSLQCCGRCS